MTASTRGFTLLELLVALTLSALVLTALMGLTVVVTKDRQKATVRAEMMREGMFVSQRLSEDLRAAGHGVPSGGHITTAMVFYSPILAGESGASASVGILGDLPRPHTQYNTFGLLHKAPPSSEPLRTFSWHNENNGACAPESTPVAPCDVALTSKLFPGGANCDGLAARTCPWGMKRAEPGDELILVDGTGRWADVTLSPDFVFAPFAAVRSTAPWDGATWPNDSLTAGPIGVGEGWVTSLDRVYWRKAGDVLMRNHCWGLGGGPSDAGWPPETTAAAPATPTGTCTGWLPMLKNVKAFHLTFRDRLNNALTLDSVGQKARVHRVDFRLELEKVIRGEAVTHDVFGSAAIRQ